MKWYAASVIMYTKFKDGVQDSYPVWENVILISAENDEEAMEKAERRGRQDEGDSSGTYAYNGRPATLAFGGIRKIIACENPEARPDDGTELTYSRLVVEEEKAFQKLLKGDKLYVVYEE